MYNPSASIILFVITLISFWWVFSLKDTFRKFFYLALALFIYIYCGFGVGFSLKSYKEYEIYYSLYVIVLGICLRVFCKNDIKIGISDNINRLSINNALLIFIIYFAMQLVPMAVNGEISLLFHPPSIDLTHITESNQFSKNKLSGVIDSLMTFVTPFFYLSLYKYRDKPLKVILFILVVRYIEYCNNAYIGRGDILGIILFLVVYLYHFFPRIRRIVIVAAIALVPSIIIFFVSFISIRVGDSAETLSLQNSVKLLVESETYYYSFFDYITGEIKYLYNYFIWFVTLPLPGFLKTFSLNVNFNALFTAEVTGINIDEVRSIALPGLVNESLFIFGYYLFFLHAILLALVISVFYNTLKDDDANFFVIVNTMISLCVFLPRGGTSGPYSGTIKLLFVFFLFYIFRFNQQK